MNATYRFRLRASYAGLVSLVAFATVASALAGCSEERPRKPDAVFVGAGFPRNWPQPKRSTLAGEPQIQAMRFSTLDIALGSQWTGDAIASPDTTSVHVRTNLFDFTMPQIAPGRFHFAIQMLDLPAFLVRPYALHVVAIDATGRESTLLVPFRIHGRV